MRDKGPVGERRTRSEALKRAVNGSDGDAVPIGERRSVVANELKKEARGRDRRGRRWMPADADGLEGDGVPSAGYDVL